MTSGATAINIIGELTDEVKNIDEQIFQIGVDLIHDNEILLIPTPDSKTILNSLINVKKDVRRRETSHVSSLNHTQITRQGSKMVFKAF